MRKLITLVLLMGMFSACNMVVVTEAEDKAVDKVLEYYGGKCKKGKHFGLKNGVKENSFDLEMLPNEHMERDSTMLALPASHIAYLFYSNLPEKDRESYTQIRVKIDMKSGAEHQYEYSVEDLKDAIRLMPVFQASAEKIRQQDYDNIFPLITVDSARTLNSASFIQADSEYGEAVKTELRGYSCITGEDGQNYIVMAGLITRKKQNTLAGFIINRKSAKLIGFRPFSYVPRW